MGILAGEAFLAFYGAPAELRLNFCFPVLLHPTQPKCSPTAQGTFPSNSNDLLVLGGICNALLAFLFFLVTEQTL